MQLMLRNYFERENYIGGYTWRGYNRRAYPNLRNSQTMDLVLKATVQIFIQISSG